MTSANYWSSYPPGIAGIGPEESELLTSLLRPEKGGKRPTGLEGHELRMLNQAEQEEHGPRWEGS